MKGANPLPIQVQSFTAPISGAGPGDDWRAIDLGGASQVVIRCQSNDLRIAPSVAELGTNYYKMLSTDQPLVIAASSQRIYVQSDAGGGSEVFVLLFTPEGY